MLTCDVSGVVDKGCLLFFRFLFGDFTQDKFNDEFRMKILRHIIRRTRSSP